jgi:CspA family cold shock protein
MKTGTVKFYNESKGFGFIKSDDGGQEVFVHATGIVQGTQLRENDKVTFEERDGKKGVNAVNVTLA